MAVYTFADLVADEPGFRVRRGADTLELEPKALQALFVLLEHRGQLVTKAMLQAAVWPDTAVTENTLTRVIAQLRKTLGDDARDARFIETVPTRGYRFIAPVVILAAPMPDEAAPSPPPPARARPRIGRVALGAAVLAAVVVVAVALRSRTTRSATQPSTPRQVLLSAAPGLNAFPSFSPDSSSLAFASDRSGSLEIYIRALEPAARETAVTADGQQNIQPAWSPDGREIAYASMGRGGIWVVPALGGAPRQISPFGAKPAWSPDSATIVFQSQVPAYPLLSSAGSGSVLWRVPAAGGSAAVQLTTRAGWGHGSAVFTPDGGRIAYAAGDSVWTIRSDGTDARKLYAFGAAVDGAFYARDGAALYVAFIPPTPTEVNRRFVRLELSGAGVAVGPPIDLGAAAPRGDQVTLAPDGHTIAFVESTAQHEIDVVSLAPDGTALGGPRALLPQLNLRAISPVYSPDGRRLALNVFRPGEGWSLWIAQSDGSHAEAVLSAPIYSYLSWLDDGRIATAVMVSPKAWRLIAFDPANGRQETLYEPGDVLSSVRVSQDGKRLAFMRPSGADGVYEIWAADLPGGTEHQITNDPEGIGWPTWSPDGRTLAVEALRRGDSIIGTVPAEGGALRPLVTSASQAWTGEFSRDGKRFVFAAQRRGVWNICLADVPAATERCVTRYTRFDGFVRTPALSPSGDRVVFERGQVAARLWLGTLP